MLGDKRISAVLCSTDLDRSRDFYEQKVGLELSRETIPNHLLFKGRDNTTLLVYGRPGQNLADHTQVRFWTDDVAGDVKELKGRGVVFEEYDFPTFKTVDSIATSPGIGTSAWFKDPDGNTIAVFQPD
jgi:catechol 2,3-dioxygenase-like lactoylglutathione lyase family enzyme